MSKLFGNTSGGGPKGWQWIFAPIALVWLLLNEPRKWLASKSYDRGWSSWLSWFISIPLSLFAVIWSSHSLGWEQNYPGYMWMPGGLFAGWCTFAYIWPLIHLVVIRGVIRITDLLYELMKFIGRDVFAPVTGGIASAARVLPGSSSLWDSFKERDRFGNIVGFLVVIGSAGYALWTAWDVWGVAETYISVWTPAIVLAWTPTWVLSVLGAACGAVVALAIFGFVYQLLDHGKVDGIAVGVGAAFTYAFFDTFTGWMGLVGLTGYAAWAGVAVAYVVYLAYLFPAFNKLLSLGLFEKIGKQIGELNSKTYGDDVGDYSKVYGHFLNFGVSGALAYVAWTVCASLGLALYFAAPIMALVALVSYISGKSYFKDQISVIIVGVGVSLYGGYLAFNYYLDAGYVFGVIGAVPAAVISALALGTIAYPLVYQAVKWVLCAIGIERLREPLDQLHKTVERSVEGFLRRFERVYWEAYRDNSDYREWFIQVINIVITAAIYLSLTVYLGFGSSWFLLAAAAFITFCAYAFFGQFLSRPADIGLHFSGGIAGLVAGAWVGSVVWGVTTSYWIVGAAAAFTWPVVYAFLFPIAYIAVRFCTRLLLASWSRGLLVGLHGIAWNIFDKGIWTPVKALGRIIKTLLGPLWGIIVSVAEAIKSVYDNIMRALRRN